MDRSMRKKRFGCWLREMATKPRVKEKEDANSRRSSQQSVNSSTNSINHQLRVQHQPSRAQQRRDQTYTKRPHRDQILQGSLDDISSSLLGEDSCEQESTLRRSRSLAINSRGEEIFSNLEIHPRDGQQRQRRRSQLIPRAKLIGTNSRERSLQRGRSQESLLDQYGSSSETPHHQRHITTTRRPSLQNTSDYALPVTQKGTATGQHGIPPASVATVSAAAAAIVTQINQQHSRPNYLLYQSQDDLLTQQSLVRIHNNVDPRTKYSPGITKYRASLENLSDGLNLPNYYPDSKCDTDLSFTDCGSTFNENRLNTSPVDNIYSKFRTPNLYTSINNDNSIPYDENIVLTKSTLYENANGDNYATKPKTIRGNTPYEHQDNFFSGKPRSLPVYSAGNPEDESDGSLSNYNPKYYEPQQIGESLSKSPDKLSDPPDVETNPIYDEIPLLNHFTQTDLSYTSVSHGIDLDIKTPIKTSIQVLAEVTADQEYKTIVSVPEENTSKSDSEDTDGSSKENKKHSHNYLKEFLESQKGSKGPLQNFLSKKISRAFLPDVNSNNKQKVGKSSSKKDNSSSNLVINQYHSLPDITISKSLQRCEKIDRKLRKCDRPVKISSDANNNNTNRFIVNIGSHFDVTAQSSIPVDFELKISKIPKAAKAKKHSKVEQQLNREQDFLQAVESLKSTLNELDENHNIAKPEVVSTIKKKSIQEQKSDKLMFNLKTKILGTENKAASDSQYESEEYESFTKDCEKEEIITTDMEYRIGEHASNKEYQDKVDTMRSYWHRMYSNDDNDCETKQTCKIIDVQNKITKAKKKIAPLEEEKQASLVQTTKELFEKKPLKKTDKVTTTKGVIQNPYFSAENKYESLNPDIEVIDVSTNKVTFSTLDNNASHKTKIKSTSVKDPEFDHVRYRVVKSDLFQKNIFAKCDKEHHFDGLMQYLQDFSFQELLIDNNIVIIEPIRSNVQYVGSNKHKTIRNVTSLVHKSKNGKADANVENVGLRRHFFYHPIRVNREVNDDELPNPDTVNRVRQMFEGVLTRSQSSKELEQVKKQTVHYSSIVMDPDKDRCSATDSNSEHGSNMCEDDDCCEQVVSEDILEKIREHGTTVTYYGGRILDKRTGKSAIMTKEIMDEIRGYQKRSAECKCRQHSSEAINKETQEPGTQNDYSGVTFKLLKSNSCSSRLELVGTKNLAEYRNKFITKYTIDNKQPEEFTSKNHLKKDGGILYESNLTAKLMVNKDKDAINETIKENRSPKIIGGEIKAPLRKMIQWGEVKDDKIVSNINYTKAGGNLNCNTYEHKYCNKMEVVPKQTKQDMEFELYEIANN